MDRKALKTQARESLERARGNYKILTLLFLAALRQIPQDLLNAATLDGAGAVQIFFRIKLPMISPVVFYNLMLSFCAALQEFNAPFVITDGGPRSATTLLPLLLYRSAFTANEMGYASAICMVLFIAMYFCNKLISGLLGKYMD